MKAHRPRSQSIQSLDEASYKQKGGKYVCDFCAYSDVKRSRLTRHLKAKHLAPRPDTDHHSIMWGYAMEKKAAYLANRQVIDSSVPSTSNSDASRHVTNKRVRVIDTVIIRPAKVFNRKAIQGGSEKTIIHEKVYHEDDVVEMTEVSDEDLSLADLQR